MIRGRDAVFLLLTFSCGLEAQDDMPVDLGTMQVTAGRQSESQYQVPQPVTVVTRDQIEKAAPQVMTDLLRGQVGVFTQSSGPGQGIAIIRGLKGSEVLHLVDGMRLNMTFFRNSPSQYIALVDPFNIRQIEVMRGPAASLYGSDAMGGVLQVLTPEHRFTQETWRARGGLLTQFGSADLSKIGRAYAAMGTNAVSFSGGFTYMDYGLRDLGDGEREPYTEYSARGGDGKVLWSPVPGHELMLSAHWFETPRLPRYFEIVGGPGGPSPNNGLPVFFEPNNRKFLHARYRWSVPWTLVDSFEAHLAQQVINDDRVRQVNASTREQEQNRSTLTGLTAQFISSAGDTGRFVYGLDFYRDDVDSAKSRTDLGTGVVTQRDPTFPNGAREDSEGAYAMAEWRPFEPWLVEAAARYSRVSTDLPATAASAPAQVDNDDVTGHLSSALSLAPDLVWTANLARGFRAPNIFDLGTLGPRPNSSPQQVNVPNTGLRPETIVSVDTGLKWVGGALKVEGSVFYSQYGNRIEPREPTGNTVPNGQYGCGEAAGCVEVRSENIGEASYYGVEAGLRHAASFRLEVYATLNYTRGEEEKQGQTRPANRVPPLNGQLGATWRVGRTWTAEPYVLFADRQDHLDDDDLGDVRIDPNGTAGWVTANLRLGWTPSDGSRLQLLLQNLLDAGYREHGSGIDAAGRGAALTAEMRFE
jgi:outer membrane receptor protein involved in Fe transport